MATIDTSKIQGYEAMSADEKVAALESFDFVIDYSGYVKKDVFDRTASDAAEWKRKYHGTLSEAEQARIAAEEERQTTAARLAEYERKEKISLAKDKYIASGFNVDLAQATAEAFVDGDMTTVLANITRHATLVAEAAKDEALHGTPAPPASGVPNPGTINYQAEVNKAISEGDMTRAAYYSRLQAEQN